MHRLQDPGRDPREADRLTQPAAAFPGTEKLAAKASAFPYCGRFAPSPTGPLHLGSLFTALASYLQARANGGVWLVRIDDLDRDRTVPGASDAILRTLERFGLLWDHAVAFQSQRTAVYQDALDKLDREGLIYPCSCTRKFLVQLRRYPGLCSGGGVSRDAPHALRMRTENRVVRVDDRLQGLYAQDFGEDIGDFIVRRSDGLHAYHLATVVDDAASGVTEIVRGIDLLESTPRQILLQHSLGLPTPAYLHVPVLVDADGNKLSKQTGAAPVDDLDPARTLRQCLLLMGLQPPQALRAAPVRELLAWAVSGWDFARLRGRVLEV